MAPSAEGVDTKRVQLTPEVILPARGRHELNPCGHLEEKHIIGSKWVKHINQLTLQLNLGQHVPVLFGVGAITVSQLLADHLELVWSPFRTQAILSSTAMAQAFVRNERRRTHPTAVLKRPSPNPTRSLAEMKTRSP